LGGALFGDGDWLQPLHLLGIKLYFADSIIAIPLSQKIIVGEMLL